MATEGLSIEQEQALNRCLSMANLQRVRGQLADAEDSCRKAIEMAPNDASIREMLGDILYECGKLDAALVEFKGALQIVPGKESLEKKFARVTLDIGEREYQKALAEDMVNNPKQYQMGRKRSAGMAILCSMLVPGLGQLYRREYVKAAVIFGVTMLLFPLVLALTQFMNPGGYHSIRDFVFDFKVLLFGALAVLTYIYGVIDAASQPKGSKRSSEP